MRIEAKLAKLATEEGKISSSKKVKRKQKRLESMPTVVQRLFDTCSEVFADCGPGIVPSSENIGRLGSILAICSMEAGPVDPSVLTSQGRHRSMTCAQDDSVLNCLDHFAAVRRFRGDDPRVMVQLARADNMKPADVGLSPEMPYFRCNEFRGAPPITYLHLYECPKFSIGIFCLPPSAVIPLHNHPGMTVFSKLLFGSLHIKSYDWIDVPRNSNEMIKPSHLQSRNLKLAKVITNTVFTAPCKTSILYPAAGGNIHCFTAKTACAVLDVLGPPYNDSEKRRCTYYNDFPCPNIHGDSAPMSVDAEVYAWLERERKPDHLIVLGAKYKGP